MKTVNGSQHMNRAPAPVKSAEAVVLAADVDSIANYPAYLLGMSLIFMLSLSSSYFLLVG